MVGLLLLHSFTLYSNRMRKDETLKNILVIVTGLLVLAFIFKGENSINIYFLIASTVIGVLSLISNTLAQLIEKVWFKIGHVLGWINTRILLTIVFYVFLFPMSLIYKLTSKDGLNRKNPKNTVFETRDHWYTKDDLKNLW